MRTRLAAALLTTAILGLMACSTVVDDAKLEDNITTEIESQMGAEVSEVSCPSPDVEAGATFECTAQSDLGDMTIAVTIVNDEADLEWEVTSVGGEPVETTE
ncbi:MAG: hypothetical protein JJLCMIEE_01432 [Acidimicrobiales bacterium]|nr:MAG: DUF4333 domain-containing protein [Actinomycetota bacterium]MBV6508372.1 hypothetical protein [Acidimicrobiales bacterium]RIK04811.1 MAG: hypothetical protein DCC48_12265 [Acidobacteriota bacterium]